MKRIKYIAKNELYSLFYSPIAWLLMILFLILTSTDYIGVMDAYLRGFIRGGQDLRGIHELTNLFLNDRLFGYFPKIITNLYMIFPLITMGLVSREVNNGTIRLLYSSPVTVSEVVLGKYLAVTAFCLALIILTGFTLLFFPVTITHPAISQMISALFGLFLVMSCYAAIGLFVSSLTTYQAVAAIVTLVLFGALNIIDSFFNNIDFLRDITYYLKFQNKSANFIKGFLNSRDLIYFLIVITAFLCFTIIRIENQRLSISRGKKFSRYAVVIVSAWLVGYVTSLPGMTVYYDSTRDGLYTISEPTRKTLAKLNDGELKVTAYANLMQGGYKFYPGEQNKVKADVWEPYIRFKPDIHIDFKYYYNNPDNSWIEAFPGKSLSGIAKEMAKYEKQPFKLFMSPKQVGKEVDIEKEENRNFFVLEYKGRKTILRTFDDPIFWPDENQISAAINRLVGVVPKIYFLTGEMERGPYSLTERNYESFISQRGARFALVNEGYDVDTISLTTRKMPTDGVALVVADPRTALSPVVIQKINAYIASGGNLMILAEPDRKELLAPILDTLGVCLRKGLLIQPSDKYSSDDIFPYLSSTAAALSPQLSRSLKWQVVYYGDTLHKVIMPGAAALTYKEKNGFTIKPLLFTDSSLSWNRMTTIDKDSLQTKVGLLSSDERGCFATSILLQRQINGRDQRIIVTGDADYFTDPFIRGREGVLTYNRDFAFWGFGYFTYGLFPPNTLRPEDLDNAYKIGLKGRDIQKVILYYIIPTLLGLAGSIILIRRKKK